MNFLRHTLCLVLIYSPWWTTRAEAEFVVFFGLDDSVWRTAIAEGLVKPWEVPLWGLYGTDPECQEWARRYSEETGERVYRTIPYRQRSAETLNAIRDRVRR